MKIVFVPLVSFLLLPFSAAQTSSFHSAPSSAQAQKNPYASQPDTIAAGKKIYGRTCAACHGNSGEGTGNVPPLVNGPAQRASEGEVFWYITRGDISNGMPSWASLPEKDRWQLVSYVKSLDSAPASGSKSGAPAPAATIASSNAPPPKPPFTDYRFEKPGTTHHITIDDLPAAFATDSATAPPKVVPRPANAWPVALPGFKVDLFA